MRLDIREQLEAAAAGELFHNGNYVLLVAKAVIDDLDGAATRPCTLTFHVTEDSALIDISVATVENPDV